MWYKVVIEVHLHIFFLVENQFLLIQFSYFFPQICYKSKLHI